MSAPSPRLFVLATASHRSRGSSRLLRLLFSLLLILAGCGPSGTPMVPEGFEPPRELVTEQFRIRPLHPADAEKDYEAVIESRDLIHAALLGDPFPPADFTLEQNRRDLVVKEERFAARTSFTYTVVSLDESKVLGCVYINRGIGGPDAAVFLWVRQSAYDAGLDPILEQAVRGWMKDAWPFQWVVFPGRNTR